MNEVHQLATAMLAVAFAGVMLVATLRERPRASACHQTENRRDGSLVADRGLEAAVWRPDPLARGRYLLTLEDLATT